MSKKWRGISRVIVMTLWFGVLFSVPAFARDASGANAELDPAIKVYVDGVLLSPADTSPESVAPLVYDGNVYLPIEAIREATGKAVEWDRDTNSVYIGETAEVIEITVSTVEEFISALGSNKRILLQEGVYNLTSVASGYINSNVYFGEQLDGLELILDGVQNLTIQGIGEEPSEIIVEPRYANVMSFFNCSNISIVNIKAGHTEEGLCRGGVFVFDNCKEIQIDNTLMYGCGTLGLSLSKVTDMTVTGSTIYECTAGIMYIEGSSNIVFRNCVFRDNTAYDVMIGMEHTSGLAFESCSFLRNTNALSMFYLSGCENVSIENTEFTDNDVEILIEQGNIEVDTSSRFENNVFDAGR